MGSMVMTGRDLIDQLTEMIGYKLGLIVSCDELNTAFQNIGEADLWPDPVESFNRYRAEEIEDLVRALLGHFGDPDAAEVQPLPVTSIVQELPEELQAAAMPVIGHTLTLLRDVIDKAPPGEVIGRSLIDTAERDHGPLGGLIAAKILLAIDAEAVTSPWSRVRRVEWPDRIALADLFQSEGTTATLGRYFDQRFVDYLDANFADIDDINWRRFESLVAEYFERLGHVVELGPGRGDDGVDIKIWNESSSTAGPATTLIQCKRERRKTTKVTIKALAADVQFQSAETGLLVTTSEWSPGARAVVQTREYPINEADRTAVRRYIEEMRTVGSKR